MEWISVKDRLPETDNIKEDIFCLVYNESHCTISIHPYCQFYKCWNDEENDDYFCEAIGDEITHWAPLPAPPSN